MSDAREHSYSVQVQWTGKPGEATAGNRNYSRDHTLAAPGKPAILASSDPAFRGDASRYNPEDLLVASISSCHMLWYLHLCAVARITVEEYLDEATGTLVEGGGGSGKFQEVVLRPRITISNGDEAAVAEAERLHEKAHKLCFIANSVNFPVRVEPTIRVQQSPVSAT